MARNPPKKGPNLITIPYKPRPHQAEMHKIMEAYRFSVHVAHRRFGKTVVMINQLIKAALTCEKRAPRYAYIAPYRNQAKDIAWDYLKYYAGFVPGVKILESELSVIFPNDARIRLYGADNPDSMRGLYLDGVVLDEYGDIDRDVWESVIRPLLTDRRGWAAFIGTPKGLNQFYEVYQYSLQSDYWGSSFFTVDDTKLIDEDELEELKNTMSDTKYRREFFCDFSASLDDILIPLSVVQEAQGRHLDELAFKGMPTILSYDPSRFGDDEFVGWKRQGPMAEYARIVKGKVSTMEAASMIVQDIREHKAHTVIVDEVGVGGGVVDRLNQLGYNVIGVNSSASPIDAKKYFNKRVEMWGDMADWLRTTGWVPKDGVLSAELSAPTYSFNHNNQFVLESKKDMKKRGVKSPNRADALAMSFAFPIHLDAEYELMGSLGGSHSRFAKTDYDILNY